MIYKSYLLEENIKSINENLFLFYGENLGLKNDFRDKIKQLNKTALIKNLDQEEILADENKFFEELFNESLFEDKKIFLIHKPFLNDLSYFVETLSQKNMYMEHKTLLNGRLRLIFPIL